jgi:hypothetical protein
MSRRPDLHASGSVPGAALRAGSVAVIVGGTLLLNPYPLWVWAAAVAALVSTVFPRSMAAWIGIAALPLGLLLTAPSAGRTALAILLVHLAHLLAAWAWAVPWRSRIRLVALLPGVRRLLVVQAIAQSVAAIVLFAVPPLHGVGFAWLAPLGAAVLAGASAAALRLASRAAVRAAAGADAMR